MAYDVHLSVVMPADRNEFLARIAKEHLDLNQVKVPDSPEHWPMPREGIPEECELSKEACWYLSDLTKRTGYNPGPKGGLSLWGIVGNYTDPEDFVESLKHFWFDVLSADDGTCSFEHIIVFYEREQSEQASCFEIFLHEHRGHKPKISDLEIKHHKGLPFAWMQF